MIVFLHESDNVDTNISWSYDGMLYVIVAIFE